MIITTPIIYYYHYCNLVWPFLLFYTFSWPWTSLDHPVSRLNHLGVVGEMVDDLEWKIAVDLSISGVAKCACETNVDMSDKETKNGKVFRESSTSPNHSGYHLQQGEVMLKLPISPMCKLTFQGSSNTLRHQTAFRLLTTNGWWLQLIWKLQVNWDHHSG